MFACYVVMVTSLLMKSVRCSPHWLLISCVSFRDMALVSLIIITLSHVSYVRRKIVYYSHTIALFTFKYLDIF